MQSLVLLQVASCFFLTGLIWTIQVVHYPSFSWIQKDRFSAFSSFHSRRISLVVIPVMLVELFTAGILLLTKSPIAPSLLVVNAVIVGLIWASTFFLSVPCHSRLSVGFSKQSAAKLVATNWSRTLLWSSRSVLWFWILSGSLRFKEAL